VAATDALLLRVADVEEIPPGWVLRVRVGNREVALANCEGTFHAVDNFCTHAAGPLAHNRLQRGCQIECPWHSSLFDVRTGEVVAGPARKPLATYLVKVENGAIYVGLSPESAAPAEERAGDA
jgi:nitrite reductase/ring-hydroxylating ferredoxin subunit